MIFWPGPGSQRYAGRPSRCSLPPCAARHCVAAGCAFLLARSGRTYQGKADNRLAVNAWPLSRVVVMRAAATPMRFQTGRNCEVAIVGIALKEFFLTLDVANQGLQDRESGVPACLLAVSFCFHVVEQTICVHLLTLAEVVT